MDHIDPIGKIKKRNDFLFKIKILNLDGVVLVDPEYVKDRKVYASVLAGTIK
jgi:hypothetical protein